MRQISRCLAFVGFTVLGFASISYASPITIPPGLAPGGQYRLVFVSADRTSLTLANTMATYNSFVTTEADANAQLAALTTFWRAIASTAAVTATVNVGVYNVPVYNLAGQLVAVSDGASGLWSGALAAPVGYDQNGNAFATNVWTGTTATGAGAGPAAGYLGALGGSYRLPGDCLSFYTPAQGGVGTCAEYGYSGFATGGWVDAGTNFSVNQSYAMYGISDVLTVANNVSEVPEPGTVSLMMLGGMFLVRKVRRYRGAPPAP